LVILLRRCLVQDVDEVEAFAAAVDGEFADGPDAAGVVLVVADSRLEGSVSMVRSTLAKVA
jgi:hypothetical protein